MKLFTLLLRQSLAPVLFAMIAALLGGLASVGLLAAINQKLGHPDGHDAALVWWFVCLVLLAPVLRVVSAVLVVRLSQRAVQSLRKDISRRILAAPLDRVEEIGQHRLQALIGDDIGNLALAFSQIPMLCVNFAVALACLIYLGWLSKLVLGGTLIMMAIGTISYRLPMAAAFRRMWRAREETDVLYKHYRGIIQGTKELKLNASRRAAFLTDLDSSGEKVRRLNVSATLFQAAGTTGGQSLVFVAIGLLLFSRIGLRSDLPQAAVTSCTIVILYMLNPLQLLFGILPDLARALTSERKVQSFELPAVSCGDDESTVPPKPLAELGWSRLELVGALHRYHGEGIGDPFTLGPLDLHFHAGELVFITGGNGSGKSTLAKLLVGLYRPVSGEVRLDGAAITDENREAFRQNFSVVFSDFYLFDSLPGPQGSNLARAAHYLKLLQLDRKVAIDNGTISTLELSHGQRKRLALLLALLEDRPIYVLDEWAADQDPLFKGIFYHQLLPELQARRKTVIAITHDDAFYGVADRILKLADGRLEEDRYRSSSNSTVAM
jgi:putative pyoverdin transport system ATP-binding/permease protein